MENTLYKKRMYVCLIAMALLALVNMVHGASTYTNPIIDEIGPADPTIIYHDGLYYMYPTGDNTSYHVYTSYDLVNWNKGPKVFEPGGINIWAPDVFYHPADGKFYLYYTADFKVGVAVADGPMGPFVDQGVLLDGFIDGHMFQDDDGNYYLYFTDIGHIYVQQMSDPLTLTGSRQVILQPSQSWEMQWGSVNEGPWMIKHEGVYYLLYSGSGADSQYYAVGYATASSPLGPFTKYSGNPIVHSGGGVYGPGHGAVTTDAAGNLWHIYHQKVDTAVDWNRFIALDPMWFDGNGILHGTATRGTAQPGPVIADNVGTVAYWRFEQGPADTNIQHPEADGVFSPDVPDSSGNGNELAAWNSGKYTFRDLVASQTVPQTGAFNNFSVKNADGGPTLWTDTNDPINTWEPAQFTIEATFKLEQGGWKTIVGRDSLGAATAGNNTDGNLAAMYFQATDNPSNGLAIKFCDVSGYWHDAVSGPDAYVGFDNGTDPDGDNAPWYSMAGVSNGSMLSLYLLNHDHPEAGYVLIAQTDMTVVNPSPNTTMTAGAGDGGDWDAGNFTVGRGLYGGNHGDRAYGFIDEVRLSEVALNVSDFLQSENNAGTVAYWRFEEGPADTEVPHGGLADGEFYAGTLDDSGNGNHLSVWSDGAGGHAYRQEVPTTPVPQIGADNDFSVQNSDGDSGMFTSSAADPNSVVIDIEAWTPVAFTIEASFKPTASEGYRTIIGRDGVDVASHNGSLAALYFQVQPDNSVAVKFADVSGYWHEAISAGGVIQYDGDGHWYHMAAVCNGDWLGLYLNDVDSGLGYQLVAEADMSAAGSPDTRLVADSAGGATWHSGGWSVGRGLFNGDQVDRFGGYIDEVRISSDALDPTEFLFFEVQYAGLVVTPLDLVVREEDQTDGNLFFSLENPPVGDVVLTVEEKNGRGQVILDQTVLTFTTTTWNDPQAINVTAVDDSDLENAEHQVPLSVMISSAQDEDYDGLEVDPIIVKVADNECGAWGFAVSDLAADCVVDIDDLARFAEGWLDCTEPDLANCTNFFGN